jgi:hypothetical protein
MERLSQGFLVTDGLPDPRPKARVGNTPIPGELSLKYPFGGTSRSIGEIPDVWYACDLPHGSSPKQTAPYPCTVIYV